MMKHFPDKRPVKALLVVPAFLQHSFYNARTACRIMGAKYTTMPLGLMTVAALLPAEWDMRLIDMNAYELDEDLIDWADIVLTGGMITQQGETRRIIDLAHAHDTLVAVGGPDPTNQPELYERADFLVLDEGEFTIGPFVEALKAGETKGTFRARGERPNLEEVPPARFDLINPKDYLYAAIQYSRGCPFSCEFCDIIELYGQIPRNKTPEQFCSELEILYKAGHRGHVGIVDDNLIGNKAELKRMLRHLIKWSDGFGWPFYFSTQLTLTVAHDDELLELLAECDFRTFYIGIETPDPDVLAVTNKRHNVLKPILDSVKKINQAGMLVHSGFLFGFDNEKANVKDAFKACIEEAGIVIAGCGLLVALPETQLERRLRKEGRLLVRDSEEAGFGKGRRYDQITQGLNYVPHRSRLQTLKDFRELRQYLFEPEPYFRRVRTFIKNMRPHKPKHLPPLKSLPGFAWSIAYGFLLVLGIPGMWWECIKTIAYGATKGISGMVAAVSMAVYYLHLGPQTQFVINDLDDNIRDLELYGEEEYNRRRHLRLAEPPRETAAVE
ncbi:MAG: B12-binding domain-containing radical SAM protein [Elusimicrobia bacterium]|nr:MAG: B12-binding domain-containing radical SAM protein [Elusimicrobiota bacterium]